MLSVKSLGVRVRQGDIFRSLLEIKEWSVTPGDCFGLWGPSGIGKTVLLTVLFRARFLDEDSRGLTIEGSVVQGFERPVYIGQSDVLFLDSSIRANLLHLTEQRRMDAAQWFLPSHFWHRLVLVGDRSPEILSGGERKALIIARSLLRSPDCLILDEPFSSLDLESRGMIADIIKKFQREREVALLLVSHQLEDFLLLADVLFPLNGQPASLGEAIDLRELKQLGGGPAAALAVLGERLQAWRLVG